MPPLVGQKVVITGTVYQTTGEPWPNTKVWVTREPGSYNAQGHFPRQQIEAKTNELGELRLELWVNENGILPSNYVFRFADKRSFNFSLPVGGPSQYTLQELEGLGVPATPGQEQTILNLITDYLEENVDPDLDVGDLVAVFDQNLI